MLVGELGNRKFTANAAAHAGLNVDVVASVYTTAGLLDALDAYYAGRR